MMRNSILGQTAKRQFSGKSSPNPQGYGTGNMLMLGAGTAGLLFLILKGRSLAHQKSAGEYGLNQHSFMSPTV